MVSNALELLVECAQAIRDGNLMLADSLLERIWKLADDESDQSQSKAVRYFAEALVRRAYGLHSAGPNFTLRGPPLFNADGIPYYCFRDVVNDAIINAAMGKKQLHLIDFDISVTYNFRKLLWELSRRCRDSKSVRVSVILPTILEKSISVQNQIRDFNELTKKYEAVTEDLKIVYANSLGEVDASMLDFRRTKDEAVVICYSFKLNELLVDTEAMEREWLKLRDINPETVIILERHADHNDSDFIKRLCDSFQYYSDDFHECIDEVVRNRSRGEIQNIVGFDGGDRNVRHQTLAQWQSHLQSAGFLPFPLDLSGLRSGNEYDFRIQEHNGSAVVSWKNYPLYFISAGKLTEENYFNPANKNFVQGFNPNLLLEDKLQPFHHFSEAFSLNRFATLVEIYDTLKEVCFTYDLSSALTWTSGPITNVIMSNSYKKRNLFIQSTFCWVQNDFGFFQELIETFESQPLQEQAIAAKAFQSSKDFHFEPSMRGPEGDLMKDYSYGGFEDFREDYAVMAICLQSSCTMDVDYVVEFFLPASGTEHETANSLALRIFNDLKNMKKRFITVKVRGTKVGFHEEASSNFPQVTMPMRSLSPTSSTGHIMEMQGSNEQESGKQTSFEPPANNKNEINVDVSNLPNSNAKRRKLTSKVWEDFTKEDKGDKVRAICTHCNKAFDGSSIKGTTHLRNHLERCKIKIAKVKDQQLILSVGRCDSTNESVSKGCSSFDQDRSGMNFARMIIKKQWPLNIVEDEYFSTFLKELQPMFKLQSQQALSTDIVRVYKEEKPKLIESFGKLICRFNLIINFWEHDLEKTSYCCYVVQFIDDNWELKKKILALKSLGNQFDKRNFTENLKKFLVDWNFSKKVCSLTIQSSFSCFDIAEEIRKSGFCFEVSHPLSTFYISSDECSQVLLDRDNSSENVGKPISGVIKTSNVCLLDILDIYYKKLSQQEKKGYPLMNVKSDNNWRTCSLVLATATILDPRFKFDLVEFSYNKIYGCDAARIQLRIIRKAFTDIFDEYASNMCSETLSFNDINSLASLNVEENTIESFHRWYYSKGNVNTKASWRSELDKYVQEPIISSIPEFDILGWWSEQALSFPILGRMVRDILAIPLSSIISGSTFTEKVILDNPIFSGLDPQITEAIICCNDWLESPKGISNVRPNEISRNISYPIVKLKDTPTLTHHSKIEHFFSESDKEAPGNEVLGTEATTWTEKDVRAYLVFPLLDEELEHLKTWQNHTISREHIGRDKIPGKALVPLLKIPPHDVNLKDARNYYIEDTVVNQFFVLLKRRYEGFPHTYLKHHSLDSSIATFLIQKSKTESEVINWVSQEDLKGVRKLFLPMCLHEHWLLFVADIDDKKLLWLDSNQHSRMSNVSEKQVILRWFLEFLLPSMGHDHKDWSFHVPKDIPQQKNSVDCALFVMKYADCLTHGNHFPFTQDDMPHFRYRMFLDLYHGSISLGRSQGDRAKSCTTANTAISKRKMVEKESTSPVKFSKQWNSDGTNSTGENARDYNINDENPSFDDWL